MLLEYSYLVGYSSKAVQFSFGLHPKFDCALGIYATYERVTLSLNDEIHLF